MKKDKTKTIGHYLITIFLSLLLFIAISIASKSIFNRWFSNDAVDSEQYNEMIYNLQSNGKNVYSDGYSITIKN